MRGFDGIGGSGLAQIGRIYSGGGDFQRFDQDWARASEGADAAAGERDAATIGRERRGLGASGWAPSLTRRGFQWQACCFRKKNRSLTRFRGFGMTIDFSRL